MPELSFAFSPCPNDTFAFHALVHGLVDSELRVVPTLLDIDELNARAKTGEFALTKVSFGVLPALEGRYRLLRSGAALGHGCGPLVVARRQMSLAEAVAGRLAIPGRDTTAYLLLRLAAGEPVDPVEARYDRILDAVASGAVDAGLIIHESRFTYRDHGLVQVADLGEWWEAETGLPIPLGAIVARSDLPDEVVQEAEWAIRASVAAALADPTLSAQYVRAHAVELSEEVCAQHIALYVNEASVDLGEEGMRAVAALTARA